MGKECDRKPIVGAVRLNLSPLDEDVFAKNLLLVIPSAPLLPAYLTLGRTVGTCLRMPSELRSFGFAYANVMIHVLRFRKCAL